MAGRVADDLEDVTARVNARRALVLLAEARERGGHLPEPTVDELSTLALLLARYVLERP
jgi:hypothetical protein